MCGLCGAKRYQTDVLGQARCATRLARAPCTPKRVSLAGACASHPAALAASEPLVLRASWGARLGARTYGVRTARLRTFLDAPLACLDTGRGVCATCPFRARLAPQQLLGGSCGAGQWREKSFEACAAGLPMWLRASAHARGCWSRSRVGQDRAPRAGTEIGEHLQNLTDNTCISERRILTQTMAHLLLLVASSCSTGLVRYRRFGRPWHCFETILHV